MELGGAKVRSKARWGVGRKEGVDKTAARCMRCSFYYCGGCEGAGDTSNPVGNATAWEDVWGDEDAELRAARTRKAAAAAATAATKTDVKKGKGGAAAIKAALSRALHSLGMEAAASEFARAPGAARRSWAASSSKGDKVAERRYGRAMERVEEGRRNAALARLEGAGSILAPCATTSPTR